MSDCTPLPKPEKRKKKTRGGFKGEASDFCWYCGIPASPPYVVIERHHIDPVGLGGTWDPKKHDPENRFDCCKGPASNHCHDKAQQLVKGYKEKDLREKKIEHEQKINRLRKVIK